VLREIDTRGKEKQWRVNGWSPLPDRRDVEWAKTLNECWKGTRDYYTQWFIKERLPAQVRDLFTFSSTVRKKIHKSIKEHLNVEKEEKQ
jgi:hypothetical protein